MMQQMGMGSGGYVDPSQKGAPSGTGRTSRHVTPRRERRAWRNRVLGCRDGIEDLEKASPCMQSCTHVETIHDRNWDIHSRSCGSAARGLAQRKKTSKMLQQILKHEQ